MAVAQESDEESDEEDDDDEDDDDEGSVTREDDMSITTCETDLPRETNRRDRQRRRRRRQEYDDSDDDENFVEAEDVSVLSTASNKRHKKHHDHHHHQQQQQKQSRHRSNSQQNQQTQQKKTALMTQPYANNLLGPAYASDDEDSSEEEKSYQDRKRRQRRSRRSLNNGKNKDPSEEELERKLAEVNRLIEESRKELEQLKAEEATKIQAFFRMYQDRRAMDSSGRTTGLPKMRQALSRTGTKPMSAAAVIIQSLVRGVQARGTLVEKQRKSRKRNRRKRRNRRGDNQQKKEEEEEEQPQETAEEEAKRKKRQEEEEEQRRKAALEAQKASKMQSLVRGFLVRSRDLLSPERLAAIRIQRLVRCALRVVHLREKLVTIAEGKKTQLEEVAEGKKSKMGQFKPGQFDNMDTRVKMVNFLKKQIEKENENADKLVAKIKAVKESNAKLITESSSNVCNVTRLELDVQGQEERRGTLTKLNQQWIDGISDYQSRVDKVNRDIRMQVYQREVTKKYCDRIVETVETRYTSKKLLKTIKFLADHSDVALGESSRRVDAADQAR
eukprot:Sro402_g135450.4  (558) ;mRNA; r:36216-37889